MYIIYARYHNCGALLLPQLLRRRLPLGMMRRLHPTPTALTPRRPVVSPGLLVGAGIALGAAAAVVGVVL